MGRQLELERYPDHGIVTANEIRVPVGVAVRPDLTHLAERRHLAAASLPNTSENLEQRSGRPRLVHGGQ